MNQPNKIVARLMGEMALAAMKKEEPEVYAKTQQAIAAIEEAIEEAVTETKVDRDVILAAFGLTLVNFNRGIAEEMEAIKAGDTEYQARKQQREAEGEDFLPGGSLAPGMILGAPGMSLGDTLDPTR